MTEAKRFEPLENIKHRIQYTEYYTQNAIHKILHTKYYTLSKALHYFYLFLH